MAIFCPVVELGHRVYYRRRLIIMPAKLWLNVYVAIYCDMLHGRKKLFSKTSKKYMYFGITFQKKSLIE